MQPRACDCSPMCVLRATNPMPIHPTRRRAEFAEASAYLRAEPGGAELARRVAGYTVLAHDPAVPAVAADYWMHSERFYRAVADPIAAVLGDDPAYQRLVADPTDTAAERRFQAAVASVLARDGELAERLRQAVRAADENVYIDYFHGTAHDPAVVPADLERMTEIAEARPEAGGAANADGSRPSGAGAEVLVVIPFGDRHGGGRLRNLMACLMALRDQTLPADAYRVTVVEFDEKPRWREVIEPWVDDYVHIEGRGLFNKSWTVNVGVRQTLGSARTLCLLDADIIVDRRFLERNHARFADPAHDAHLPHTEMLSLDQPSSDRAIEERCGAGAPEAPLAGMRGLLLRDVPGACLWIRPELFDRVGGLDERYRGWGGEDEDMLYRITEAGAVTQYDDVFLHMAHRRPAMRRDDGEPFNAHIPVGTWTGERGYGDPAGPVPVEAFGAFGDDAFADDALAAAPGARD